MVEALWTRVKSSTPFWVWVAPSPSMKRLAPDPLNGGGMEHAAVEMARRIAEDEKLSKGVKKGKAVATPNLGHSVHVKVEGLRADRWYWCQF